MTSKFTHRRRLLGLSVAALFAPVLSFATTPGQTVQVWKDPNCGCCADWVTHMQDNGFKVQVFDTGNTAVRKKLGMPQQFGSCHTALIDGYVIEGHVPANDIKQLLAQRPAALGLAVPGMPIGTPGMDGEAYKGRQDAYDVLLVQRNEQSRVFKRYASS
jgi:hypothetical protein